MPRSSRLRKWLFGSPNSTNIRRMAWCRPNLECFETRVMPSVTRVVFNSGSLVAGATQLQVGFDNYVLGADNATNFKLQSVGPDGLEGNADDVNIPLTAIYTGSVAVLSFSPLPSSVYRLTVMANIVDGQGNKIDGDGDGVAGGNFLRDFVIVPKGAGLSSSAFIATLAGRPFQGDGGPATDAGLSYPQGVAIDGQGNVYIADTSNQRIREVNATTHMITTVAGNGNTGFNGDGIAATSASLNYPNAVAVDGQGNVYIADTNNQRIREVNATTHMITTAAGNGNTGFKGDGIAGTVYASLNYPKSRSGGWPGECVHCGSVQSADS